MRTFLLYLTLILFSNANAQDNFNCKDSLGRKQGHWIIYGKDRPDAGIPADGKVEEGNYIDDRKEGTWIKYHDDGQTPKLKGEYKNNRPYSIYEKTWENGNLREIGHFEKNKQTDSLKRFYENGQLEYEAWFNENGKEQGIVNYYYPNGQLEYTWFAKDGVPSDTYHYDQSGNLISSSPNQPVQEMGISPQNSGQYQFPDFRIPQPEVSPKNAAQYSLPSTPENPNTQGVTFQKDGYNKVYNEEDELLFLGVFKEGKFHEGKYYVYDKDGILLQVRIYKSGIYYSDGQL